MVPRLASAYALPALLSAVLLALIFSSGGSARVDSVSGGHSFSSRNGEIVFLSARGPNGDDLYLMRPDGTHQRRITSAPGLEMSPSWSPDGTWIAFARSPRQLCLQIFLLRANGTGLRQITHDGACYGGPTWLPGGKRILSSRCTGYCKQFPLWSMNLDGTDLRKLKGWQSLGGTPIWSPDGTTMAVARSSPPGIWLMNTDETNQRQLTMPLQKPDIEDDHDSQPAWSPDGAWIAFSRSHDPHLGHTGTTRYRQDIYVIRPDGTGLRKLTRLTNNNVSPTWSPDGKRILFASDRGHDDRYDIYVMNMDGTRQKRLTKTFDNVSPNWQPIP